MRGFCTNCLRPVFCVAGSRDSVVSLDTTLEIVSRSSVPVPYRSGRHLALYTFPTAPRGRR